MVPPLRRGSGYIARDRDEEQAPFIVESVRLLDELKPSGAIGVALRWSAGKAPQPDTARAVAALCAAHPASPFEPPFRLAQHESIFHEPKPPILR